MLAGLRIKPNPNCKLYALHEYYEIISLRLSYYIPALKEPAPKITVLNIHSNNLFFNEFIKTICIFLFSQHPKIRHTHHFVYICLFTPFTRLLLFTCRIICWFIVLLKIFIMKTHYKSPDLVHLWAKSAQPGFDETFD